MGIERGITEIKTLIYLKPLKNNQRTQHLTQKSLGKYDIQGSIDQVKRVVTSQTPQQTQLPLA